MADRYGERGEKDKADASKRLADGILAIFRSEGGKTLEVPGYEWIPE